MNVIIKAVLAVLSMALLAGTAAAGDGGMVIGGPLSGTILPGDQGGMVIGGPLSRTILPPAAEGGMIIGGPLSGSILPPGTPPGILLPLPSDREDD